LGGRGDKHCGVALRESRENLALAAAIRELRARERLSQEELSLAAGLHRGYVWELESGRRRVSFASVAALATALEMPLSELIDRYEAALERLQRRA